MTVWTAINAAYSAVFDPWFALLAPLSSVLQIFVTSIPVTLLALLVYRYASNQDGIRLSKDRIKGYLLETWLYKDDLKVMLRAQGAAVFYSLRYLKFALVPMAVMILPLALVIVQLESNFAFLAKGLGETAIFAVTLNSERPVSQLNAALTLPKGVSKETPVLRVDEAGTLLWRLRINAPGEHDVLVTVDDQQFQRRLVAGARASRSPLWPHVYSASDWRVLGSVAEAPLPTGLSAISTEIDYSRARGEFLGLSTASWLLLLFTLIMGFALRGAFGVTF